MLTDMQEAARANRLAHGALLERKACRHPDRYAIRAGDDARTYRELDEAATRIGRGLRLRGVTHGDRIAIATRNRVEFVELLFGAWRIGAIVVPINFRLAGPEIAYILKDSGASLVVADESCMDAVVAAIEETPCARLVSVGVPGPLDGAEDYEALFTDGEDDVAADVRDEDVMCILYTSGTTGRPKGAVLTHQSLAVQSYNRIIGQHMGDPDQVWLSGFQLFHIAGISSFLTCMTEGGEFIVLRHGGVDAQHIVDLLLKYQVRTCSLIPTLWREICDLPGIDDVTFSLRRISWGSMGAGQSTLDAMARVFGDIDIFNVFGQTETASATCILSGPEARDNMGSVGRALPSVEVRVVDADMRDVGVDEVGEIVYRGPTLLREYWNNPGATAAAFAGGWFHSGDLGRLDAQGLLWVVDRKKDMIISGGENIYSAEVESAVDSHPKVREVSVVGMPHPRWGESPVAVIVPVDPNDPPTLDEIRSHCAALLAGYKRPQAVQIVSELPRNTSGKVQKFVLRERAQTWTVPDVESRTDDAAGAAR